LRGVGKVWKSASKHWTDSEYNNLDNGCSKGSQKIAPMNYNYAIADRDFSFQES
tara:strand:- start:21 stop:182 length:162 start_codon:yes stop_codon:yes gene_type:complete